MYPHSCPMMQTPCWYCMTQGMQMAHHPMMHYPMMMPEMKEYEFEEKKKKVEKIKFKRDDIEVDENLVRGAERGEPSMKPIEPVTQVQSEQHEINIINKIEIEAPDIKSTLITLGLSAEAARRLIIKIVELTHKHSK